MEAQRSCSACGIQNASALWLLRLLQAWMRARGFVPVLWRFHAHDGDGRQSAARMKTSFFA
jgi:hypothetical protein